MLRSVPVILTLVLSACGASEVDAPWLGAPGDGVARMATVRIDGDPVQVRQLFQNLIGNALKFHKPGEAPHVQVYALRRSPGQAEVFIEDNGIGFDKKDADRVFLPFQRLHGRSEYEGTGIGLTICQKIVERHGGTIRAESAPGVGSTFVFTLPIHGPVGERHAA